MNRTRRGLSFLMDGGRDKKRLSVEEGEDEKEGRGWRHGLVLVEWVEEGAAEQGGEVVTEGIWSLRKC